jgi:hypothetical protein
MFDAQTKDLEPACYNYYIYRGKKDILDRTKLPVFKSNPNDKEASVWKSQDERSRANASVPKEFKDLKFVNVIAGCHSARCQFDGDRDDIIRQGCPSGFGRQFEGKIAIKDGLLTGDIYDIEKDDLTEKKLNKWKILYPKEYRILMKKYKHEPFAAHVWNSESSTFPKMCNAAHRKCAISSYHKLTISKTGKMKSKLVRFPIAMQPKEAIKTTTTGKKR